MDKTYKCPVCESQSLDTCDQNEICKVCGWEDCGFQRDNPDEDGSPNWLSLNQARKNWKEYGVVMTENDFQEAIAFWEENELEAQ